MSLFSLPISVPGQSALTSRSTSFVVGSVAAAHVLVLVLLMTFVPADRLAELTRPLTVRLIEQVSEVPPPPPRLLPERARPAPPTRIMAVAAPTPTSETPAFAVPPQPPEPVALVAVPPTPTFAVAPPAAETPVRFDAAYLNNPKPFYPAASRRFGEVGKVMLRVHVGADGRAMEVEIKNSCGFPRLDNAARGAVTQWRFVPARRGDEAVAAWVVVPIIFSLEG